MTSKITLTMGLPCSGKSTWAKDRAKKDKNVVIVCRDDIRKMLFGKDHLKNYRYNNHNESLVTSVQEATARAALAENRHVIVADTNLSLKTRSHWTNIAQELGVPLTHEMFLNDSVDVLVERDARRADSVGEDVIRGMYERYKNDELRKVPLTSSSDHTHKHNPLNREVIIVDLDGTLAIHNNRSPYDYSRVWEDSFDKEVWEVVRNYAIAGKEKNRDILFVSGRKSSCHSDTVGWLSYHTGMDKIAIMRRLFMRRPDDNRADTVVKKEILINNIEPHFNVVMAFDDRESVVNMWRQCGIKTMQVNHGKF